MKSLGEFLFGSLAYALHLSREIESLACHRVVEIHSHGLFADFAYGALHYLSGGIEHRNRTSQLQQVSAYLPIDCESLNRKVEHILRIVHSVALLRGKYECEIISLLLALEFLLETRKKHTCAVDVLQRLLGDGLVCKASVNHKFVADSYNRIFAYFHIYLKIN